MSDAIAFEFRGKTIGVLARAGDGFVFYSGGRPYHALDGVIFAEPRDLYLALRRLDDDWRRGAGRPRAEAQSGGRDGGLTQAAA